ncbi:UvrD-helicase domain-containing protein [Flavobacterium sp. ENC]|uniref:UvrD-helicase domain-containing protein n=1 Tax=Flavobacterium sp. ENC TaxID=2897330 RepID=UPI001E5B6231|nr:UvrD-helicase domain-containing protein [Flavobacterium sp. ENC]MCD0465676.1 AAA family ATPase [Flavobacterium sp. ENC]
MVTKRADLEVEVQEIFEHIDNGNNFLLSGGAGSGKTYSLVQVIRQVIEENPFIKVACMTYTNAAVKEIEERVNHKNLNVTTIHDFLWDCISNYQKDLKKNLIELINDSNSKISTINNEKVGLDYYDKLEKIKYDNFLRVADGIISHDEVIILAERMFKNSIKLCSVVKDKFPFIFIDEYQDTQKEVIEIFLNHLKNSKKKSIVGFFGDAMQSIYEGGIGNLDEYIGQDDKLREVQKTQNRRNPKQVYDLANELRTDGLVQSHSNDKNAPNMDKKSGEVKKGKVIFYYSQEEKNEVVKQNLIKAHLWNFENNKETKELNLTHNLIAKKAGFPNLIEIYDKDPIVKYLQAIRKYIRIISFVYDENIIVEDIITALKSVIVSQITSLGLKSFTALKFIENLKSLYPTKESRVQSLLDQIKPIEDNTIKEEHKVLIREFKEETGITEIDFVYQIKVMKEIEKGLDVKHIHLYNSIKKEKYQKVRSLFFDKDNLIDDKKQNEEDESKKGSKRDVLIKFLYKIQFSIDLYEQNKFNEFLQIIDLKKQEGEGIITFKKRLKKIIDDLKLKRNERIENILNFVNHTGLLNSHKDDRFNKFIVEKKYLYDKVKEVSFSEFINLYNYLEGKTPFSTQHKTKGDEFDNVLVVLDNGKWNDYNFKYLFEKSGNQSVLERTQKIFYVCCTRAKEDLAVYYYGINKTENGLIFETAKEWFGDNLIDVDKL